MRSRAVTVGTLILRGLGWGAALGAASGILDLGVALFSADVPALAFVFLPAVAMLAVMIGALYGAAAGVAVAAALAAIASPPRSSRATRLVGAVVATLVVIAISTSIWGTSWDDSADDEAWTASEYLGYYYVIPGVIAAAVGGVLTPRLLLPRHGGRPYDAGAVDVRSPGDR